MTTTKNHHPGTAREALLAFYPDHGGHTVVLVRHDGASSTMTCTCGLPELTITREGATDRGWTMKDIKDALRNVPTTVLGVLSERPPEKPTKPTKVRRKAA